MGFWVGCLARLPLPLGAIRALRPQDEDADTRPRTYSRCRFSGRAANCASPSCRFRTFSSNWQSHFCHSAGNNRNGTVVQVRVHQRTAACQISTAPGLHRRLPGP